jgi:hypothetical protein
LENQCASSCLQNRTRQCSRVFHDWTLSHLRLFASKTHRTDYTVTKDRTVWQPKRTWNSANLSEWSFHCHHIAVSFIFHYKVRKLKSNSARCRLAGGRHIQAGDMVVFDSAPKSRSPAPPLIADFVVVIEKGKDRNCMHGNQLYDLPAKIDTVLRASQGINSTKYALLTFGAGKPFSIHTMDGTIWSGRRGIQNALAKYITH